MLISFDALRYDHVSHERNGVETMPFLDRMSDEGLCFKQHVSTGSGSSTSLPGIHASAMPLDHGYGGLNENHRSLAEALSAASVQTLGITPQASASSIYGYDRGFGVFQDWTEDDGVDDNTEPSLASRIKKKAVDAVKSTPVVSPVASEAKYRYDGLKDVYDTPSCPYARAETVTDTSLSLVDEHLNKEDDFFVWVHYVEPHMPYYPPEDCVEMFHDGGFDVGRMRRLIRKARRARHKGSKIVDGTMVESLSDDEVEAIKDFYAAATRYADREAERLVEGLDARGMLDDSVVFFTADHGEELFDHGTLGHRPKMYEELVHVPLIVYDEGGSTAQGADVSSLTSHLDLAPTVADLLDVEAPEEWRGVSLTEFLRDAEGGLDRNYVFSELCHTSGLGGDVELDKLVAAVRRDGWKYIQNRQLDTEELYDLRTDPDERTNVIDENEEVAEELRVRLSERLEKVSEEERRVKVSGKVQQRLKELGYVEE